MKNTIKSKKIKYNKTRSKGGASLAISMTDIVKQAKKDARNETKEQIDELINENTELKSMVAGYKKMTNQLISYITELEKQNKELDDAMARLSSGLRINSAADDAAGSAIASKMEAQVRSLEKQNKDKEKKYNGLVFDYKHLENKYAATNRWYDKSEQKYKELEKKYKELHDER